MTWHAVQQVLIEQLLTQQATACMQMKCMHYARVKDNACGASAALQADVSRKIGYVKSDLPSVGVLPA